MPLSSQLSAMIRKKIDEAKNHKEKEIEVKVLKPLFEMQELRSALPAMDVVRLLATIKQSCGGVELENEQVYMNTVFSDFVRCVMKSRSYEVHNTLSLVSYDNDDFLRSDVERELDDVLDHGTTSKLKHNL